MTPKRIVSFLPSATEILYQLGAGDQLVGVTHECDFPAEAKSKPRVIHSSFDPHIMNSKEIDAQVVKLMQSGGDIYLVMNKPSRMQTLILLSHKGYARFVRQLPKRLAKQSQSLTTNLK